MRPRGRDAGTDSEKISQLRERIYSLTGRLYGVEDNIPSTSEMRVATARRLKDQPWDHLGPYRVTRVSHLDGTKWYLEGDQWALIRFSGTEPMLRLFVEADSPAKAKELVECLKEFIAAKA